MACLDGSLWFGFAFTHTVLSLLFSSYLSVLFCSLHFVLFSFFDSFFFFLLLLLLFFSFFFSPVPFLFRSLFFSPCLNRSMCVGLRYPREDQEDALIALSIESGKLAVVIFHVFLLG